MKVVYIPNNREIIHTNLTPGKIYDVIKHFTREERTMQVYHIVDDNGQSCWYNDDILITLDKHRESKLNQLGI